jgi:hypothetical protein
MNCYKHSDAAAVAFCRTCGKPLCAGCQHAVQGTIVCEEHAPQQVIAPPPPAPAPEAAGTSTGLAFVLGLIPGVGAIYNSQYAKAIVHVVVFGILISLTHYGPEPIMGLLVMIWYFYMPFEAYHTAKKRQLGQPVDEFSSIFPMQAPRTGVPIGPIALILLGVLFLLNTMDVLRWETVARWWPVALIAVGAYMLYCRLTGNPNPPVRHEEAHNEQQ